MAFSEGQKFERKKVLGDMERKAKRKQDEKIWEAQFSYEIHDCKVYYRGYLDALAELRKGGEP